MKSTPKERSVCSKCLEPAVFWIWKKVAGQSNSKEALRFSNVEEISFQTSDSRIIRGFKARATNTSPKGYILFAQGNAMLADQTIRCFAYRSMLELYGLNAYDIYVYDYRGYGLSEGKSRLESIVSDYKELIDFINLQDYPQRLLYGISFGGIILSNSIGRGSAYDRLVIDSAPSRLEKYRCPKDYDPVENLSQDCSKMLIICGKQDNVIPISQQQELIKLAQQRGATIVQHDQFRHSFMDRKKEIFEERLKITFDFLTQDIA